MESDTYCTIQWRDGARKVFVLITDEDSDMPTDSKFRFPKQEAESLTEFGYKGNGATRFSNVNYEPNFDRKTFNMTNCGIGADCNAHNHGYKHQYVNSDKWLYLSPGYESELSFTSNLLMENNVDLFMFISSQAGTTAFPFKPISYVYGKNEYSVAMYQFGDPYLSGESWALSSKTFLDFSSFDSQKALSNLVSNNLQNSLMGKILSNGGYARIFEIESIRYEGATEFNPSAPYLMTQTQIQNIFSGINSHESKLGTTCVWKNFTTKKITKTIVQTDVTSKLEKITTKHPTSAIVSSKATSVKAWVTKSTSYTQTQVQTSMKTSIAVVTSIETYNLWEAKTYPSVEFPITPMTTEADVTSTEQTLVITSSQVISVNPGTTSVVLSSQAAVFTTSTSVKAFTTSMPVVQSSSIMMAVTQTSFSIVTTSATVVLSLTSTLISTITEKTALSTTVQTKETSTSAFQTLITSTVLSALPQTTSIVSTTAKIVGTSTTVNLETALNFFQTPFL